VHILNACSRAGVKVHLFCMVGYPGTSRNDAEATVRFLLENESLIDTADLVGFRLDRGIEVPGIRPVRTNNSDWGMSVHYEPTQVGVLRPQEVSEIEAKCQEILWEKIPRLLHPLYRIVGHWDRSDSAKHACIKPRKRSSCLISCS
jgi:hypothetical protein